MPSELQAEMTHPERPMVAHPFNPGLSLPLVEPVAGTQTDNKYIEWGKTFFADIGMHPLHCRVETAGFLSDRLQEALWREALWPFHDKVATATRSMRLLLTVLDCAGRRWARCRHSTWRAAKEACGRCWPCSARVLWPTGTKLMMPELTDDFVNEVGDHCEKAGRRPESARARTHPRR